MFSISVATQESPKPCHNSGWSLEVRHNTITQTDVARPFKVGEGPNDAFERQSYWQFSVKLRMQ